MMTYIIVVNDNGEMKAINESEILSDYKRIIEDAIEDALDSKDAHRDTDANPPSGN